MARTHDSLTRADSPTTESWVAVVPAAGRGSRLGIDAPKVFADLGPVVAWEVIASRLSAVVRHAHLVLSPAGAAWLDQHPRRPPRGLHVTVSVQREPVGMGDAVIGALPHVESATSVLVVWGDQLGISSSTLERVVQAHAQARAPALTLPLLETSSPYVDYRLDEAGRLLEVRQAREGEACGEMGLADVGVFALSLPGLAEAWARYCSRGEARGRRTGEWNFLPFLAWLSVEEGFTVHTIEVTDPEEARGLNTPDDLEFFRARFSSWQP